MPIAVQCPTCHRRETWRDGTVVVEVPGGSRKPSQHPARAAWAVLQGGHTVVGACEACGQPLVSEDPGAEAAVYTITLPRGALRVGPDGISGPGGAMTVEEAAGWIEGQIPAEPQEPGALAFTLIAGALAVAMLGCWVFSMLFVTWFLWGGTLTGDLWR